jgi:hypothetical protein
MVMRRLSRALARRDCLLVFLEQLDAIAAAGRAVAGELAVLPGCRGMRGQDVEQQSDCAKASRPSPHAEYTSNPQPAAAPTQQHTHTQIDDCRPGRSSFSDPISADRILVNFQYSRRICRQYVYSSPWQFVVKQQSFVCLEIDSFRVTRKKILFMEIYKIVTCFYL